MYSTARTGDVHRPSLPNAIVNPYSTPNSEPAADIPDSVPAESLSQIARSVFLAWERLRIPYILVLATLTVLATGLEALTNMQTLVTIVGGAIVANVCYFAGPIVETYVRWLGYEKNWVRWLLFVGGTLLTALLAFMMLATALLPDQN